MRLGIELPTKVAVAVSLALGSAWACGQEVTFIEAPEVAGARSYLYAFEQVANIELRATADASSDLGFTPADWYQSGEPLDITRLALSESLEELQLQAGTLGPSAPPNRAVRELDPLQIDVTSLLPDVDRLRLLPGTASEALLRFSIPRPSDCPEIRDGELVAVHAPIEALTLDDARVIALAEEEILLFHADDRVERWPLPPDELGGAIALSDSGRIWVATSSAVRPFDPAAGVFGSPAVPIPLPLPPVGLMVREAGPELWLLSRQAELFVSDTATSAFELAAEFPSTVVRADELGTFSSPSARFAPLEGEDFLLAGEDIGVVLERRAGTIRLLAPEVMGKGFGGILRREDGTVVLSESLNGTIYLYDRGVLDPIGQRTSEISAIARFDEDRFIFVTGLGIGGLAFLDARSCPEASLPAWTMLRTLARLGDRYLVGGQRSDDDQGFGLLTIGP